MAITADAIGLLFKAKGDTDDARKAFAALRTGITRDVDAIENKSKTGFAGSESAVTKFKAALPAVGVAIAAMGAALVSATVVGAKALFNLAQSASDFGSEIQDASEKTGLSAQTLSALKFGADQAGSSFEQVTKGIVTFGIEMGKAADGNEKARAKMAALNVTATDLRGGLAQVITTIFNARNETERLALANEAFGKRIGPDLIPLIIAAKGNLDDFERSARELGVTIDDKAARAADEFGDQMTLLSAQIAGVGRTVGTDFMPIFLNMSKSISNWLKENRSEIQQWSASFAKATQNVADGLRGTFAQLSENGVFTAIDKMLGYFDYFLRNYVPLTKAFSDFGKSAVERGAQDRQASTIPAAIDYSRPQDSTNASRAAAVIDQEAAREAADKRAKEREAEFQKELAARERGNALMLAGNRSAFSDIQRQHEEAFTNRTETEEEYYKISLQNIAAYKKSTIALIKNAYAIDSAGKSGLELENAKLEANNALAALNREIIRESADVRRNISDQRAKAAKEQESDEKEEKRRLQELAEIEKKRADDAKVEHARKRESWKERLDFEVKMQELADAEADRAAEERIREEERQKKKAETDQIEGIGGGVFSGIIDGLGTSVDDMLKKVEPLKGIGNIIGSQFQMIAQGVGAAVKAFVLFGSAGGSFKKFAAEMLASIAQMAIVQAIWELAQGFAMLALAYFGHPKAGASAAQHFVAAGIYGAIGGVAAIAGRAVAGDSFKKETNGGYGTAGNSAQTQRRESSGGQGKAYSGYGDEPTIIETGINQAGPGTKNEVAISFKDNTDWFSRMFKIEWKTAGGIRELVKAET